MKENNRNDNVSFINRTILHTSNRLCYRIHHRPKLGRAAMDGWVDGLWAMSCAGEVGGLSLLLQPIAKNPSPLSLLL